MKNNPDLHHRRSLSLKDYDYFQAGMYFITICTQNHQCLFGEIIEETMHINAAGEIIIKWYWELSNKFPDIQCDEHIVMPNHFHFIIHKIDITTLRTGIRADTSVCPYKDNNKKLNNDKKSKEMNCRGEPACSPTVGLPNPCPQINLEPKTNKTNNVGVDLCVRPKDNKNSSVEQKKDEHTGSPLRKIKKNGEQIMENEKNVAHTMGSFVPKIMQWLKTMTTNEYIYQVKQDGWKPFHYKLWQRNYYEHIIRNEIELNQILEYFIYNPLKRELDQENKQYYER